MAGISWVKIETTLPHKPIVLKLRRILKKGRNEIVGMLVTLLCWADGATADGNLGEMLPEDIDYVVSCDGFGRALVEAGWLIEGESGLQFSDWSDHNGYTAKRRAMKARGMEIARSGQNVDKTVHRKPQGDHEVAQGVHLDKRREDKIHANACNARARVREKASALNSSGDTYELQYGPAKWIMPKNKCDDLFLDEYAKKPKSPRAFQVEWATAIQRVDPEVLIQCAKLYRASMTDEDYRFQLAPENWLADRRYDQFLKEASRRMTEVTAAITESIGDDGFNEGLPPCEI